MKDPSPWNGQTCIFKCPHMEIWPTHPSGFDGPYPGGINKYNSDQYHSKTADSVFVSFLLTLDCYFWKTSLAFEAHGRDLRWPDELLSKSESVIMEDVLAAEERTAGLVECVFHSFRSWKAVKCEPNWKIWIIVNRSSVWLCPLLLYFSVKGGESF